MTTIVSELKQYVAKSKNHEGMIPADTVLVLLSLAVQNEREASRKRQAEGIAAAKARGVKCGRPIKTPPDNFANVVKQWECGKISFKDALEQTGLKPATFYRRLSEYRAGKSS